MKFLNPEKKLSKQQIQRVELSLGIKFPSLLVEYYLKSNGGEPEPYVFQKGRLDTVVSEFLPLISNELDTSPEVYKDLVLSKQIVPNNLYPFAIDGGGDYFFLDLSDTKLATYFYMHDTVRKRPLVNLRMSFGEFWQSLKQGD